MTQGNSLNLDTAALSQATSKYEQGNETSFQLRSRLHAESSAAIPGAMGGRAGATASNVTDQVLTDYQQHYDNNMRPLPDKFRQTGRAYGDADVQAAAAMNIGNTINP